MALHNPSGLYQGQAPLNPLPYVNIALQARARKQAREEAIDKYYQNLPNTINDKGVRDQEIEGLNTMKNDIYSFAQQNKEALRNPKKDNGAAQFTLQKKFRDASAYAQESKNRTATAVKLSQLRGNPKYDYIFRDPKIIDKIAAHEAPIGTEGAEGINFDQLTLPPPPFDANKYLTGIKIKPNPTEPEYKDIPGDKLNRLEITGKKFSPEDLNSLHIQAQTELENNPSFEKQIKENVEANPKIAAQMADIFQKHYGHPVETEGDLAAAYTLSMLDLTPTQKTVPNTTAIKDRALRDAKIMEDYRQGNRLQLLGKREEAKAAGEKANDLWIDAYLDKIKGEAQTGKEWTYKFTDGKQVDGYTVPLDPVLSKAIGFDDKNKGVLMLTKDGKYIPVFYKTDENYNPIQGKDGKYAVDNTRTNILSQDAIKLALGGKAGVKQLNKEMTPKGTVHSGYSRADLKGAGWSDKQIEAAVKAGKLKLND